ncbi:MAG: tRNA-dihydrouridine synthase, partial [Parasporobacterium sp.]|nr:tRNA-dihydrouridine synthase [Parasporobacterium sp.]
EMILRQLDMMIEQKGEFTAIREMRKHISWYTAGCHNSTKIRKAVNETVDKEEIIRLLDLMK